jgi:protein ImuB
MPGDSHQPEAAAVRVPALNAAASGWPAAARLPGEPPDRPLRLFARPEPIEAVAAVPDGPPVRFRWRKVAYDVAAAEGPERIASEWWHDGDPEPTRDYFRVEDVEGHRFWLFRRGLFGRESVHPAWYLHGLFG